MVRFSRLFSSLSVLLLFALSPSLFSKFLSLSPLYPLPPSQRHFYFPSESSVYNNCPRGIQVRDRHADQAWRLNKRLGSERRIFCGGERRGNCSYGLQVPHWESHAEEEATAVEQESSARASPYACVCRPTWMWEVSAVPVSVCVASRSSSPHLPYLGRLTLSSRRYCAYRRRV